MMKILRQILLLSAENSLYSSWNGVEREAETAASEDEEQSHRYHLFLSCAMHHPDKEQEGIEHDEHREEHQQD